MYPLRDRGLLAALVAHLEASGSRALVLTVDNPGVVTRERLGIRPTHGSGDWGTFAELAAEIARPEVGLMLEEVDPGFTWSDLEWLRSLTELPLLVKGIQCVEDAQLACDHAVDGIVASNHGGHAMPQTSPARARRGGSRAANPL